VDDSKNVISERINNKEYSTRISPQKHYRHIRGTKEYQEYASLQDSKGLSRPSILYLTLEQTQNFIIKYSGTGRTKKDRHGNIMSLEYIEADFVVGAYEYRGVYTDTNTAMIKYSKKNAHLVAVKPLKGESEHV